MIWTVWANSGESLETVENWHPDKVFKAYMALELISERTEKQIQEKGGK